MLQMSESDLSESGLSEMSDVEEEDSVKAEEEDSPVKADKEKIVINNVVCLLSFLFLSIFTLYLKRKYSEVSFV